jgi:hypothetical protein
MVTPISVDGRPLPWSESRPPDYTDRMYTAFLLLHSWLRWVALGAGAAATIFALRSTATEPAPRDRAGLILTIAMDLQLVIGLLLYFAVSPNMAAIRADFGAAMRSPQLRFFAVEHATGMIIALVLAHLGRVLARKAATPRTRRHRQILCYGLATLVMAVSTPWPGLVHGRPLFRL